MKWIFLLLALLIPGLAGAQSYNALSYTAGSFNPNGCNNAGGVCFADLPVVQSTLPIGTLTYCKDCKQATPCAGSGNGALAILLPSGWSCSTTGTGPAGPAGPTGPPGQTGQTGPPGSIGPQGPPGPSTLAGYTGPVGITGNSGNGTDKISGVSINGVANPLAFPGADLGAKINAAMTSMPNGGKIEIPAGTYTFTTTIQCPITSTQSYIIEGAGNTGTDVGNQNTYLQYTGNGDAFNQVITNFSYQNAPGCQLRDFNLAGDSAGVNAIGYHFGGTTQSATWNVNIRGFKKAGIEIENSTTGEWTERFDLEGMLWGNGIGINMLVDNGGDPSLGHGYIKEWLNTTNTQIGIQISGYTVNDYDKAQLYTTNVILNGNIGGGPVWNIVNGGFVAAALIDAEYECNATTCVEANLSGLYDVFNGAVRYTRGGGPWTITGTTANYEPILPPSNHIISSNVGLTTSGNNFYIFPRYVVARNGSMAPNGPQQLYMNCDFSNACTTYPTFSLFDISAGADVAGASVTCIAGGDAANNNHYALTGNHSYTIRSSAAATGCTGTLPFMVTVDQVW